MTSAPAKPNLGLSKYLNEVHADWLASREDFPRNAYSRAHWPTPFFGNPATARVATVGCESVVRRIRACAPMAGNNGGKSWGLEAAA